MSTRVSISSDLSEIYSLEDRIILEVGNSGYDESSVFAVRLALDEALINAYRHGNCEDREKQIQVEYEITRQQVSVAVEDEGEGFNKKGLPDPRRGARLMEQSGRGVFLIRQFMSSVRFNEKGNRIELLLDRKPNLNVNSHGLAHWTCESAEVLELDPGPVERSPGIVFDSIMGLLDNGRTQILVDLRFLNRIGSAVLGSLVGGAREAESRGGRLVLVRPQPDVDRVVRASSLDLIINVYADIKIGLENIRQTVNQD